jgi:RND family efflux transporter MFP subunit
LDASYGEAMAAARHRLTGQRRRRIEIYVGRWQATPPWLFWKPKWRRRVLEYKRRARSDADYVWQYATRTTIVNFEGADAGGRLPETTAAEARTEAQPLLEPPAADSPTEGRPLLEPPAARSPTEARPLLEPPAAESPTKAQPILETAAAEWGIEAQWPPETTAAESSTEARPLPEPPAAKSPTAAQPPPAAPAAGSPTDAQPLLETAAAGSWIEAQRPPETTAAGSPTEARPLLETAAAESGIEAEHPPKTTAAGSPTEARPLLEPPAESPTEARLGAPAAKSSTEAQPLLATAAAESGIEAQWPPETNAAESSTEARPLLEAPAPESGIVQQLPATSVVGSPTEALSPPKTPADDKPVAPTLDPLARAPPPRRGLIVGILITCAVVALAAGLGWAMWDSYMGAPWTRDGTVRAYVVTMAPEVAGRIVELPVVDNQFVHKGDLLLRIDPTDYKIAVSLAEAAAEQAQANAENTMIQAERRRRVTNLAAPVEEKQNFATNAQVAQAQHQQAVANLDQARVNLKRTEIRSPVNGWVTNLLAQRGDYAAVGMNQISLVDADSFWVDAYFEETNLGSIREGDSASVMLMGYNQIVRGHVGSIAAGINVPNAQPNTQGIATVNPIFTWVRLAQRIPVRIHIDNAPEGVRLAAGLTATVQIDSPRRSSKFRDWVQTLLDAAKRIHFR